MQQKSQSVQQQQQDGLIACAICGETDTRDTEQDTSSLFVQIRDLKPRFSRHILRLYPFLTKRKVICISHVVTILQHRIDELLQEDLSQFTRLQEDAMRNLEQYEIDSKNWQDQFEKDRSFGERAADNVARVGGSWSFVFGIAGFILAWAIINIVMDRIWGNAPDPYPFILLNLCLSMVAATQAPVIMMAQNRQAERDREQNIFVADAILRNEHQTKHVEAKLDHLLSFQWKRLLEIHEIQSNLLQFYAFSQSHHSQPRQLGSTTLAEFASSILSPSTSDESKSQDVPISPVVPSAVFAMNQGKTSSLVREPLPMGAGEQQRQTSRSSQPTHQGKHSAIIQNPFIGQGATALPLPAFPNAPRYPISSEFPFSHPVGDRFIFKAETIPDPMTHLLLRHYFGADEPGDALLFSHWHEDGDNFSGVISHVSLQLSEGRLQHIHFSLQFPTHTPATMDDIFSGEATVILRNDFGVPHMHMHGRIARVRTHFQTPSHELPERQSGKNAYSLPSRGRRRVLTWLNGELPPRYKPAFALRRQERVTEIWKTHVHRIDLVYTPPPQVAAVHVPEGFELTNLCVTVFPVPPLPHGSTLHSGDLKSGGSTKGQGGGLEHFVGGRVPDTVNVLLAAQEKEEGVRFLMESRSFPGLKKVANMPTCSSPVDTEFEEKLVDPSKGTRQNITTKEALLDVQASGINDTPSNLTTNPQLNTKRPKQVRVPASRNRGKSPLGTASGSGSVDEYTFAFSDSRFTPKFSLVAAGSSQEPINGQGNNDDEDDDIEPDLELEPYAHRMDNPLQYLYALVAPRPLPSPIWQSLVGYNWVYGNIPTFSSKMIPSTLSDGNNRKKTDYDHVRRRRPTRTGPGPLMTTAVLGNPTIHEEFKQSNGNVMSQDNNNEETVSFPSQVHRSNHMYASPRMVPFGPSGPSGGSMLSTATIGSSYLPYSRMTSAPGTRAPLTRGLSFTGSTNSGFGWKTPPLSPQQSQQSQQQQQPETPAPLDEMESFGLFDPNDSFHESPKLSEAHHLYPFYLAATHDSSATTSEGIHMLSGGSSTTSPMTISIDVKLKGPATYILYCEETKVGFHGMFVPIGTMPPPHESRDKDK